MFCHEVGIPYSQYPFQRIPRRTSTLQNQDSHFEFLPFLLSFKPHCTMLVATLSSFLPSKVAQMGYENPPILKCTRSPPLAKMTLLYLLLVYSWLDLGDYKGILYRQHASRVVLC